RPVARGAPLVPSGFLLQRTDLRDDRLWCHQPALAGRPLARDLGIARRPAQLDPRHRSGLFALRAAGGLHSVQRAGAHRAFPRPHGDHVSDREQPLQPADPGRGESDPRPLPRGHAGRGARVPAAQAGARPRRVLPALLDSGSPDRRDEPALGANPRTDRRGQHGTADPDPGLRRDVLANGPDPLLVHRRRDDLGRPLHQPVQPADARRYAVDRRLKAPRHRARGAAAAPGRAAGRRLTARPMASEYDPLFGRAKPADEKDDLEPVRERFLAASKPYLRAYLTWGAWALILPAAAFLTPGALAFRGLARWALRAQGNLSLIAVLLSGLLFWQDAAWAVPGVWMLLLGHSFYILGGISFLPFRRYGLIYQIGGFAALWPGGAPLLVLALTLFVGNLWMAWS